MITQNEQNNEWSMSTSGAGLGFSPFPARVQEPKFSTIALGSASLLPKDSGSSTTHTKRP